MCLKFRLGQTWRNWTYSFFWRTIRKPRYNCNLEVQIETIAMLDKLCERKVSFSPFRLSICQTYNVFFYIAIVPRCTLVKSVRTDPTWRMRESSILSDFIGCAGINKRCWEQAPRRIKLLLWTRNSRWHLRDLQREQRKNLWFSNSRKVLYFILLKLFLHVL